MRESKQYRITVCVLTALLLGILFFIAINVGSLHVSFSQLWKGLFVSYDETVATIYHIRFPRIFLTMIAGAALSVSGVLLQAVMKNPLADPGIIGVSGGASIMSVLVVMLFPQYYFMTPIFACTGGLVACFIVYSLSWKSGLNPLRMILIGVAIQSICSAVLEVFNTMSGGNLTGVASIVNQNISLKTWDDVTMLAIYIIPTLCLSLFCIKSCDLLALDDKTLHSLGINVTTVRIILSVIAVLLASITTAILGVISFLALLVPHIARILVGHHHKILIPYSMLLGACLLLAADTIGRIVLSPYEISAGIVMAIIGGPLFIFLLRRSQTNGSETY